jgi:hypothetical protein
MGQVSTIQSFSPGDRVDQIAPFGLAPIYSHTDYPCVIEADEQGVILSRTPGGPPILDHLHREPFRFPLHIFRKVTWKN